MTIQEIIDHRIRKIARTSVFLPKGYDADMDREFVDWLNDKFPRETFLARHKIFGATDAEEPTREKRSQSHFWAKGKEIRNIRNL